ncbi:Choline transporter-like protein 5 [Camelus dromedarius]|uniref:Choline transporter-like protein n=1 Tax=Camelus dromedarius TaxID=9838 RepID=A0A5N4DCA3_CAMDR|nr:Choline transporter-like protein 5 [Camelus dromedarius]
MLIFLRNRIRISIALLKEGSNKDILTFILLLSLPRYHTGSLAFGSLILATVQMFRLILEYLDKRLKQAQSNISKFLKCCLRCCFWCLEKAVRFLNRNAYVMVSRLFFDKINCLPQIAIYGKNFCRSARDAFNLLMRNILKVAVMDRVTDFVLILGKILVAGCIVNDIFILFFTLQTVIIGSYLIAHGFFSVYAMCIETIFICFLEDLERNDGSTERPYYMSQSLLKILKEQNAQTEKQ